MVAAWIKAEIGVGPSMASGSQTWRGNWADLAIGPINTNRQSASAAHPGTTPLLTAADNPSAMPWNPKLPVAQ